MSRIHVWFSPLRRISLAASLLAIALALGCDGGDGGDGRDGGDGENPEDALKASLSGHDYVLESAQGFELVEGTTLSVGFEGSEISVSAGCNQLGFTYDISLESIFVRSVSMTEMGCDAALHAQDDWLAEFFGSEPKVELDGDRVTLSTDEARLVLLDTEVAVPDRELTSGIWHIHSIVAGTGDSAGVSSIDEDADPTVEFASDGSFALDTGCNEASGEWSATTDTLTFASVTVTERACADDTATDLEAHLLSVFADGTAEYEIDARSLTLQRGASGVLASTD